MTQHTIINFKNSKDKKWNTNKIMPEAERDIIFITYDNRVFVDYLQERDCGIRFYCDGGLDWFDVKLWQYTNVMFNEELHCIVEEK